MAERAALRRLSRSLGVLDGYRDADGEPRHTTDLARERLAAALGYPAETEADARRSLGRLEARARSRLVAPLHVVRRGRRGAGSLRASLPEPVEGGARWTLHAAREDGRGASGSGRVRLRGGRALIAPRWLGALPDGVHELTLEVEHGGDRWRATQTRVVAPRTAWTVEEALGAARVLGLLANLYTIVRPDGLGRGDLRDLGALVELAAGCGARFVGLNPLHAQRAVHAGASPYTPVSRLFRDPAYLDVGAVPELADTPAVRERLASGAPSGAPASARGGRLVDHARARRVHRELCAALHRTFRERGTPERRRAYDHFRAEQGQRLDDFAAYLAIDASLAAPDGPRPRREWPSGLQRPDGPDVARFVAEHAVEVDEQRWLQFELDRQLGELAGRASARGVDVGLYQDVAVASDREGADGWMFPGLLLDDVSLGAPPDAYSRRGQDWDLPPWNPLRLAEGGAELWTRALRAGFRHAGALRIDHAFGLVRQFWIPRGLDATDGAYVEFPGDALFAIAALESRRARALLIAEDLGTVPPGFRARLTREGWLRSSLLYFERGRRGTFRPAADYPEAALATAGSHDHAPLAGFWTARDVELRHAAGELDDDERRRARERRAADRRALVRRLVAEGLLDPDEEPTEARVRVAVHAMLARVPSRMVGVALDDLAGEQDPVNLPGLSEDRHPSWRRAMRPTVDELDEDPVARACLDAMAERGGRAP